MRHLLLAFLFLSLSAGTANAAAKDLFLKNEKEKTVPEQLLEPETLPEVMPETEPPKEPPPVQDAKKYPDQKTINTYYGNCVKHPEPRMGDDSQKAFCACTASKMAQFMLMDEIKAMYTDTKEGAVQRDRMMALVYVPRMKYPVRDMVYAGCSEDLKVKKTFRKAGAVCNCLAESMGDYISKLGPRIIEQAMAEQKVPSPASTEDIIGAFFENPGFQTTSAYHTKICVQKHEFGW